MTRSTLLPATLITTSASDLRLDATASEVSASVMVTNRGTREGKEVVQLYLELPGEARPVRRLATFAKVGLESGKARQLVFTLSRDSVERPLSFWKDGWRDAHSRLKVFIGASATDIRLTGEVNV